MLGRRDARTIHGPPREENYPVNYAFYRPNNRMETYSIRNMLYCTFLIASRPGKGLTPGGKRVTALDCEVFIGRCPVA